jgi:hypothetical protein
MWHAAPLALLTGAAFVLYLVSATVLQARDATLHFGADSHLYAPIADGIVFERVVRFHPVTVGLALAWLQALEPLGAWFSPHLLLKVMFAAVGAVGVWAATAAFSALVPRRTAMLWGIVYAVSFGVWYFASIEESKIVTATLCAAYIAVYLRLRERWTAGRAVLLTGILLLACLNEVVSGFLVVIPAVDVLVRRGWDLRESCWIVLHAAVGPLAFAILEIAVNGWLVPEGNTAEGQSHISMLLFYLAKNEYGVGTLYGFVLNWLFFNIAAPAAEASYWVAGNPRYGTYFGPALGAYFSTPAPACLVGLVGALAAAGVWPRYRVGKADTGGYLAAILIALGAYTLLRGAFFFVFNPREPLLFSPAVTLAVLLMAAGPLAASEFPAKRVLLSAVAVLLFVTNGAFIIGR